MLGLDIGSHSIKAVLAKKAGNGYQVALWAEVPTPESVIASGQVTPGPDLVPALRDLLQKLGKVSRQAIVSIPAQQALIRRLPMPKLPPKRLRALIESQGQQLIPFYRDGAAFDFVVVNPNLSPTEQEILLVAVPVPAVQRLQSVLKEAGLKLAGVEIDVIALYRAGLTVGALTDQLPAAVLDLGHQRARLGIFQGGWPVLTRALDSLPLLPSPVEPPGGARFLSADEFSVEVRRTTEILLSQARIEAIGRLMLSSRADEPLLLSTLEEDLRIGGRTVDEFQALLPDRAQVPPGMALAFGLSLAPVAAPRRLALLPRATGAAAKQRRTALLLFLVSLIGAGAYGWFWQTGGEELKRQEAQLTAAIAAANAELAREAAVAAAEAQVRDVGALRTAYETSIPWTVLHPHLQGLLPERVALTTISASGSTLSLSGSAAQPEDLAAFVQNLHESELILSPELASFTDSGGVFAISAKLRMGGQAQ